MNLMIIFGLIGVIGIILFVAFFILAIFNFRNKEKRKKYFIRSGISFLVYFIFIILALSSAFKENNSSDTDKNINSSESSQLESYKAKESSEKAKKKSEESSKTESSKSDNTSKEETDKMIEKADKEQLAKYKKALKKVPERTNNAITSAYVKNKNASVAVLNDSVMGASSNELKSIAKSAFDGMQNIMSQYLAYDGDYAPRYLYIIDSSDNIIARSSITGKFKYEGE